MYALKWLLLSESDDEQHHFLSSKGEEDEGTMRVWDASVCLTL